MISKASIKNSFVDKMNNFCDENSDNKLIKNYKNDIPRSPSPLLLP